MALTPALVPADAAAPRWRRKPEARPEEVLDAALDQFIAKGFAATRMEDVATAAGLSKAAVYLYFPSKDALFQALISTRLAPIRDRLQEAADGAGADPVAALHAVVSAWAHVMSDERLAALPRIVMGEAARFPDMARFYHDEVTERTVSIIETLYLRGMAQGRVRPLANPRHAARALLAPLVLDVWRRQAFAGIDPPPKPAQEIADDVFDLFFHGVVVRPSDGEARP